MYLIVTEQGLTTSSKKLDKVIPINIKKAVDFIKPEFDFEIKKKRVKLSAGFINIRHLSKDPKSFLTNISNLADSKFNSIKSNLESTLNGKFASNMSLNLDTDGFYIEYDEYFSEKELLNEHTIKLQSLLALNYYFNNTNASFVLEKVNSFVTLEFTGVKLKISLLESAEINADKLFLILSEFYKFESLVLKLNQLQQQNFISIELEE